MEHVIEIPLANKIMTVDVNINTSCKYRLRFNREDIKEEFNRNNIIIEDDTIIRKQDGIVIGKILNIH